MPQRSLASRVCDGDRLRPCVLLSLVEQTDVIWLTITLRPYYRLILPARSEELTRADKRSRQTVTEAASGHNSTTLQSR